jgi:CMP-N-acetylneuraminic acid synthetase
MIDGSKALAIIPARGGSKRLPRKNVINFGGRPIIAYTIKAALEAGIFERVLVSTEDAEIAETAGRFGAEISERPDSLAGDDVGVASVCLDLLDREAAAGRDYGVMCCLYATAPLRNAADIRAVAGLIGSDCDFAMAVSEYENPPLQALRETPDGNLAPMWPEWVNVRSQDAPELLVDNGSTYAVSVEAFRREKSFYGPKLRGHVMPRERSVDIDTAADLDLAKYFASKAEGA